MCLLFLLFLQQENTKKSLKTIPTPPILLYQENIKNGQKSHKNRISIAARKYPDKDQKTKTKKTKKMTKCGQKPSSIHKEHFLKNRKKIEGVSMCIMKSSMSITR